MAPKNALEILATGRLYSADEALSLGWVRSVGESSELEEEVFNVAKEIAANAPLTVKAAKLMIKEVLKPKDERDKKYCEALVENCFQSADCREGQDAFRQKKKTNFSWHLVLIENMRRCLDPFGELVIKVMHMF